MSQKISVGLRESDDADQAIISAAMSLFNQYSQLSPRSGKNVGFHNTELP